MPKPISVIIVEAIFVGLLLIPFTYIGGFFAKFVTSKPDLADVCKTWNDNYIMEVNLFIAGFLFHIVFQVTGLNEWYAKKYCSMYM